MSNEKEKKEKKKGGIVVLVVGLVVIILALVVTVVVLATKNKEDQREILKPGNGTVVTNDNVDEVFDHIEEHAFVEPGSYKVTMNTTWTFEDGASPSIDAYVENDPTNTNPVYFDILMGEDEEVIYKSPIIPLGSRLEDIVLEKELDAGTYDCVIKYVLVDDDGRDLSYVRLTMTIVVKS